MASLCAVSRECGGCPHIDVPIEIQRTAKRAELLEILSERQLFDGPFDSAQVSWDPTVSPLGYRNRIRLRVLESGRLGFFNDQKSLDCSVLRSDLRQVLREVSELSALNPELFLPFDFAEVRAPDQRGVPALYLGGLKANLRDRAEREIAARLDGSWQSARLGPRWPLLHFAAEEVTPQEAWPNSRYVVHDGICCHVPVGAFMQVNDVINAALVDAVVRGAREREVRTVADLYCGAGNFLLPLAASGCSGVGVEISQRSVRAASEALGESHGGESHSDERSSRVGFVAEPVDEWMSKAEAESPPDLVVVDPPRAGLKNLQGALGRWGSSFIAYCSCNPKSLADDLEQLKRQGYEIEEVLLFDMFAHTRHLEVLTWLKRTSAAPSRTPRAPE